MIIERQVISKLIDGGYIKAMELGLDTDCFITGTNMSVFNYVKEFYQKYGKSPSVEILLSDLVEFDYIHIDEDIEVLIDKLISERQKAGCKDIIMKSAEILENEKENPYDFITSELVNMPRKQDKSIQTIDLSKINVTDIYNKKSLYVPTGLEKLDALLEGGVRKTFITYIVARPYVGKSALMKYCVYKQLEKGFRSLIITSEEDPEILAIEIACMKAKINPSKFLKKKLNDKELSLVKSISEKIYKNDIIIIGSSTITPNFIKDKLNLYDPDIYYVDSFSSMSSDKQIKDRTQKYEDIAQELERIKIRYGKNAFILHHTTRENEFISYTDEVERKADVIFWLDTNKELESENKRLLKIRKLRGEKHYKFKVNNDYTNACVINWDFDNIDFDVLHGVELDKKGNIISTSRFNDLDDNYIGQDYGAIY